MLETQNSRGQFWLRKLNPVENKNGPICPNSICLARDKCLTFGRGTEGVNYRLISRKAPLMISRKHATIAFKDEICTITDHKSLNGISINGVKIQPEKPHPLSIGDRVVFGCKLDGMQEPEFEYIFQQVPRDKKAKRLRSNVVEQNNVGNKKRRFHELDNEDHLNQTKNQIIPVCLEHSFDNQIKVQEEKIRLLTQQLTDKQEEHETLAQTLEKREQDLIQELDKQNLELQTEKQQAEKHLSDLLEQQLRGKELELTNEYEGQILRLKEERDSIEKNLQEELNVKLTERETTHREELEKQKQALNKILNDMEVEKKNREEEMIKNQELLNNLKNAEENEKKLDCCLKELRRQIREKDEGLQKQQDITKKAEESGKRLVLQQMEDEFTCMICHELFVHAVTLTCAHSFCEMCLRMWMKKKKDCPVCRKRINGRAVKSLVLDSAINRMIGNTDNETKQYRQALIAERNAAREAERESGFHILLATDDEERTENHMETNREVLDAEVVATSHSRSPAHPVVIRPNSFDNIGHIHDSRYHRGNITVTGYHRNNHGQYSHGNLGRSERYYEQDGARIIGTHENIGARVWHNHTVGNRQCFVCGARGHFARNCHYNRHPR